MAVFQRGDSVVIVAAYDQTVDGEWVGHPSKAALFLWRNELAEPRIATDTTRLPRGVFTVSAKAEPRLLSFELYSEGARRAARARYGLRLREVPRTLLAVSHLLVLEESERLPTSLERAIPHAKGSLRVKRGEHIGLFWEVYGLGPDAETLHFGLTMHKVGEGQLGKMKDVARRHTPPLLSLVWQEVAPARMPIWGRSVELTLPGDLLDGLYVLYLVVQARGREPVQTERALLVE